MSTADKIQEYIRQLPEPLQAEVLRFTEYLWLRNRQDSDDVEADWRILSLSSALRDIAEEDSPYTEADLKEIF